MPPGQVPVLGAALALAALAQAPAMAFGQLHSVSSTKEVFKNLFYFFSPQDSIISVPKHLPSIHFGPAREYQKQGRRGGLATVTLPPAEPQQCRKSCGVLPRAGCRCNQQNASFKAPDGVTVNICISVIRSCVCVFIPKSPLPSEVNRITRLTQKTPNSQHGPGSSPRVNLCRPLTRL